MPFVTGRTTDFHYNAMGNRGLQIVLTPSGTAVSDERWFPSDPLYITPDGDGYWTYNLISTDFLRPLTWYIPSLRWLDSVGNYVRVDYPDWRLFVPAEGGAFADLVDHQGSPVNSLMLISSDTPPVNIRPNQYWINTANGGSKLYRAERV
jgi:hypothetical protein